MRLAKLVASILLLTSSMGIYLTHSTDSLFPWHPMSAFVGLGLISYLAICARRDIKGVNIVLAAIILFAVFYRVWIFKFPGSLLGVDPDTFALWIRGIVQEGSIERINNDFYQRIPLFSLLVAVASLVQGTAVSESLLLYPIVIGVLAPLISTLLYRRLASTPSARVSIVVAALGTAATTSTTYAYISIPQSLASMLYLVLTYVMIRYVGTPRRAYQGLSLLLIVALAYTHKLPPFLVVGAIIVFILMVHGRGLLALTFNRLPYVIEPQLFAVFGVSIIITWMAVTSLFSPNLFIAVSVVCGVFVLVTLYSEFDLDAADWTIDRVTTPNSLFIAGVILISQWIFISDFFQGFIIRIIGMIVTRQFSSSVPRGFPGAELVASSPILALFGSRGSVLLPMLLVSLSVVYLLLRADTPPWTVASLAFVVFPLALAPLSLIASSGVGINAPRIMLNIESAVFALIGLAVFRQLDTSIRQVALTVLVVILLANQLFAAPAMPDHPNMARKYLTAEEVEAKQFGHSHIDGPIHTDQYFAQERIGILYPSEHEFDNSQYHSNDSAYLNRTLLESGEHIMQRDIKKYQFSIPGSWELTWNPIKVLNRNRSKVHTTGQVSTFWDNDTKP